MDLKKTPMKDCVKMLLHFIKEIQTGISRYRIYCAMY